MTDKAYARGYSVTAVVRDPARYSDLGGGGVTVVRGDVTDTSSVAAAAAGHAGAVHAVSPFSGPGQGFDTLDPGFFVKAADARAHTAGLERLRERAEGPVDWVMLTPAGHLEHGGRRTGRYRVGGERLPGVEDEERGENGGEPWLWYADLAIGVVHEIQAPLRHRTRVSVFSFRNGEEGGARKEQKE
ncbi:NAD(P)H-binding protein [Streptomyces sp. NPDC007205]|uniref:NAD(P)H-binding protein n=1 Tax=Streptomyces sp. NPDC007205 TaxID=3154316 RepID=UPI003405A842